MYCILVSAPVSGALYLLYGLTVDNRPTYASPNFELGAYTGHAS